MRQDLVRRQSDHVPPRRGHARHGNHQGLAGVTQYLEFPTDLVRRKGASPAAVHAQHDGPHVRVPAQFPENRNQALAADGAGRLVAAENHPDRGHDRDLRAIGQGLLQVRRRKVVGEVQALEQAAVTIAADDRRQPFLDLVAGPECIDQAGLHRQRGGVAAGGLECGKKRLRISLHGPRRQAPAGADSVLERLPEGPDHGLCGNPVRLAHFRLGIGLREGLVIAGLVDVPVDAQVVQCLTEIGAVIAEAGEKDGALGVHVEFVGPGG